MTEINTIEEIYAGPENVWKVLSNLKDYYTWNTYIIRARGVLKKGEKLELLMKTGDKKPTTVYPTIIKIIKNQELRWEGNIGIPGIFDVEHYFLIQKIDKNKCKLIQGEKFSGIAASFFIKKKEKDLKKSFREMNSLLKRKAEKLNR